MKTSWIFKSRWMALLFAAGIIWFAYDVASTEPGGDNSVEANQASAALNNL